jgi:hypothetical protein
MKRKTVWICFFVAALLLSLAILGPAQGKGTPKNPSLFEKRFQGIQIIALFPVDPDIALQWVPPAFDLVLNNGMATGVVAVIHSAEYCSISTPNSPPLKEGENVAPDSVVHFWFQVQGPDQTLPVDGATIPTGKTVYYYDVADLVTTQEAHSLYRRAGRPAVLVSDISFSDSGQDQTVEITFPNGSMMFVNAHTNIVPGNRIVSGNSWQYHVGGNGEMGNDSGVRLDPANGNPSNLSATKAQYLAVMPGIPGSTQVTIEADPGTIFEDCFGMTDEVTLGVLFSPTNVVLNASRGDLLWTDYPNPAIPVPPALPEP